MTVTSDPGYLRRILQNLLSNAIRYTDRGRVLMGVRRSGASARIEVWDTGCGIAEADQAVIFQEFKQISPNAPNGGLGLGLAIVERACKGLGHPLDLWSEPGTGSCFSIMVPRAASIVRTGDAPLSQNVSASVRLDGLLVLLVENNPNVALAISHLIESHMGEVIIAANAEEAMAIIREIDLVPDALLIDYQLGPGKDGVALSEEVRARFGHVPTAIISANKSGDLRTRCKALGLPLLSKPVDAERVCDFLVESMRARPEQARSA